VSIAARLGGREWEMGKLKGERLGGGIDWWRGCMTEVGLGSLGLGIPGFETLVSLGFCFWKVRENGVVQKVGEGVLVVDVRGDVGGDRRLIQ